MSRRPAGNETQGKKTQGNKTQSKKTQSKKTQSKKTQSKKTQSKKKGAGPAAPILLLDAGHAAGWRRAVPDLDQLDAVVAAAREVFDDTVVLAEASLKWSLPDEQQGRFEEYRGTAKVLCAPGGTTGGHHAFLAQVARAAADAGRDVWILSALSVGDGPWRLARLRRVDGDWQIDRP